MAGIYIHIPFCKQACHYCDFHFSTSLKKKNGLVKSLCKEIELRKEELRGPLETIYFGGGTPSLLSASELHRLFDTIKEHFEFSRNLEITLEANPDDLSIEKLKELQQSPVNRLSIGIQSFFEKDLKLMNRAHSEKEAYQSVRDAKQFFENISIDLIYGIPEMTNNRWLQNLKIAFELNVPHLSCYALTVEPKTALKSFIDKGIIPPVDDEVAQKHHQILLVQTVEKGFVNYEFSNFGKPGFESRNNLGYWLGKPYLGIGPSAHSYDGQSRSWNVANNSLYMKAIDEGILPLERETLTLKDHFNEFVMTRLRTQWGIKIEEVKTQFGEVFWNHLESQSKAHIEKGYLEFKQESLRVTNAGKFLSDGIASDLFLVHLKENT